MEIAPGMVKTDEFALTRFAGDEDKAAKVYQGVAAPLTADDVADTITWAITRPSHVNIDLLVVRPRAQASNTRSTGSPAVATTAGRGRLTRPGRLSPSRRRPASASPRPPPGRAAGR